MSTVVTMSSTVGAFTSGQTYLVRSRTAENWIATSKATATGTRGNKAVTAGAKVGK